MHVRPSNIHIVLVQSLFIAEEVNILWNLNKCLMKLSFSSKHDIVNLDQMAWVVGLAKMQWKLMKKMIQMHSESQSSSAPISSSDIVDKFMGATSRSDYYPGKGYGPPSIGKSSHRKIMESQLEQKLMDNQANYESKIAALEQINIEQREQLNEQREHINELLRTVKTLIKGKGKCVSPSIHVHSVEGETNFETD